MTSMPGHNDSQRVIKISGTVTRGIGESTFFTEIPWVKNQFKNKLGINNFPGTFNITVIPEYREMLRQIKEAGGIEITPEDKNFCAANSFHVIINHRIKGAAIIPQVDDYPEAQLEIISDKNIKDSLLLKDGDLVEVEIYLQPDGF